MTRFFIAFLKVMVIHLVKSVIQPVEKIIYDPNSLTRLKNIKRHETELNWIKVLQSPFPLGFNDNDIKRRQSKDKDSSVNKTELPVQNKSNR